MSSSNRPSPSDWDAGRRARDAFRFDEFGPEEYELTPEETDLEDWDDGDGWRARIRSGTAWLLVRLAWVGLAAVLSLGSAGIVAATGQSPANDSRPELTYGADQALSSRLDAGIRSLALLNDDVSGLGDRARELLANLAQVNQVGLDAVYQKGDRAVYDIDAGAAALSARLECKALSSARDAELAETYSQGLIDRWREVCSAIDSVAPLADDWASMENGARVAMQVAGDINAHDQAAADALQSATQGRYADALTQLATAAVSLADAQRIATELAKIGDVSTLTEWLSRTRAFDDALALLWQTMIDSKGRITSQVTAALKAVGDAKALLPDNNAVLQVVLYELAGNLTSDGISIETAKGQLGAALGDLTGGMVVGG
ncbi:MAG: hypothetical protein ABSD62_03235 [Candidatus Limnocylindrales bacterium]|jgi:hypothetical protein